MNTKSRLKWHGLLVCALALPGCYTTTVSSGRPAAKAGIEYDEKWHHGVVFGMAELSGPHNLEKICPDGWSEITTETSFLNGFVDAVTSGVYNPQNITVRCALPSKAVAVSAAPAEAVALPASEPAAAPVTTSEPQAAPPTP
jgi:hypothetical protein